MLLTSSCHKLFPSYFLPTTWGPYKALLIHCRMKYSTLDHHVSLPFTFLFHIACFALSLSNLQFLKILFVYTHYLPVIQSHNMTSPFPFLSERAFYCVSYSYFCAQYPVSSSDVDFFCCFFFSLLVPKFGTFIICGIIARIH